MANKKSSPRVDTQQARVFSYGINKLITRQISANGTQHLSDPYSWVGSVELNVTFTRDINHYAADNDPHYVSIPSAPTGSGSLTLRGIRNSDYARIFNLDNTSGTKFGSDEAIMFFSLSVDEKEVSTDDNGVNTDSYNKFILYKCNVGNLPPVNLKTKSDGEDALRDIVIDLEISPIRYRKQNGVDDQVIYEILNSVDNANDFASRDNTILLPNEVIV